MPESTPSSESPSRVQLLRDVLIFQAKLWLEGFKDIALMPLSGMAAAIDFVFGSTLLYGVMRLGDRFERWIHLYAALEDEPAETTSEGNLRTLDHLLNEAADGIEEQAPNGSSAASEEPRPSS
jgi:hypothetical protein